MPLNRLALLLALLACATGPRAAPDAGAPVLDLPALAQRLGDADPRVREQAAAQLGQAGPQARAAVAPLIGALGHEDPYLRGAAAVALGRLGAVAVPALRQALAAPDVERRWSAAIALSRVGAPALPALPELTGLLADAAAPLRHVAAVTLGGLGPAAAAAAPALTRLLSDRDEAVRRSARAALAQVAPGDGARPPGQAAVVLTLQRLLPGLMAEHRVPGLAIALIRERRVVWVQGYGQRTAGSAEGVTPDTVFEAASMSKPILAMLALQMADAGQLALDQPGVVDGLQPALPQAWPERQVTARMLLSHTAGYPNWRPGGEEREGPLPLLFQPGARFGYSGEGIFLLQRHMERVSGLPLERLARQRLFAPLDLHHSDFGWTPQIDAALATGHDDDGAPRPRARYLHPNAAYTLYTTAGDYARLLVEMLKAERGESALLSQAAARQMLHPQVEVTAREPIERPGAAQGLAVHWGLGWSLNRTAQGDIAHHSGANRTGFRSFAQFSPARGSGLVILTNGAQGDELWRRLVAAIGDL